MTNCCHNCCCKDESRTADSVTPTTNTAQPNTASAATVDTDLSSLGTAKSKTALIEPILSDLVSMLLGQGERVPWSPYLHLAAQSVEFELADRLMDRLDEPGTPTH